LAGKSSPNRQVGQIAEGLENAQVETTATDGSIAYLLLH